MEFSVTRISQSLVAPSSAPTPPSQVLVQVLELSVVDRIPVLHCNARTLHVGYTFLITTSFKLLVPEKAFGLWRLWLIVLWMHSIILTIPYEKLLPSLPQQTTHTLVQMQVTQFGCKGFVIGLIFCHNICDGLGAAQFLNAVGEMARGAKKPSTAPEWCRNFLPSPPPNSNLLGQQLIPP